MECKTTKGTNFFGDTIWLRNQRLHREGAPALIGKDGKSIGWYLNGAYYRFDSYCEKMGYTNEEKFILKLKYGGYNDDIEYETEGE